MKKVLLILMLFAIAVSCSNDDDGDLTLNEQDFLIFGHFYGECGGEQCVETFKLTNTQLFEDTNDDYAGENLDFTELENTTFEQVKDLIGYFPNELLSDNNDVFGCPDCADGGGLFIQYSKNGIVKSWRIDQGKASVPAYLHSFMDQVNEKISLINN